MARVVRVHRSQVSLVAAAACWGAATVVSKRAVDEIDPLALLPIELVVSVAVLGASCSTNDSLRASGHGH